jgi:hypothetical protein
MSVPRTDIRKDSISLVCLDWVKEIFGAVQLMRVWPLKTGLQKQVLNYLMLLGSRAFVVSDKEKAWSNMSGVSQEGERK